MSILQKLSVSFANYKRALLLFISRRALPCDREFI
jgi:hypothetical protein